ncbi:hypothetical protein [Novosphingobium gossypii]|uniref:hypothetical protein n=1 Tax=Novosphingobium gossypii TaxID=1604774 RepID=UPI003D1EAA94
MIFAEVAWRRLSRWLFGFAFCGAVSASALGQPAQAQSRHQARLVRCDGGDCLLLSGTRSGPDAPVRVNGHPVGVVGGRGWKLLLPVRDVRAWSLPGARSIVVTTKDPGTEVDRKNQFDLPIGMLGNITELAYLVIPQR